MNNELSFDILTEKQVVPCRVSEIPGRREVNVANTAGKERGSPLSVKGGRSRLECFNLIKAKTVHLLLGEKNRTKQTWEAVESAGGCIM